MKTPREAATSEAGQGVTLIMDMIPQDSIPRKKCANPTCENPWLPATSDYFHRSKATKDGFNAYCKACRQAKQKVYLSRPDVQTRREAYYSRPEIQERELSRKRAYYAANRSKIRKQQEDYRNRAEIHERLNKQKRAYYWEEAIYRRLQEYRRKPEVRAKRNAYSKSYQSRPDAQARAQSRQKARIARPGVRESDRIQRRRYYSNPTVRARYSLHRRTRRARRRAVLGTYTPAQIQEQLARQKYRCYYAACGHARFEKHGGRYVFHVEHTFPLSRVSGTAIPANDISYLVLACPSCNTSKGDKFPWEWSEGGRLL